MSSQARFQLFLFGGGVLLLGLAVGVVWMGINGRSAPIFTPPTTTPQTTPLPLTSITDLLQTQPTTSVTIDAYYSGTIADFIPTPIKVQPGPTCPGLPSNQILADQPLRPWLYLLNGMASNDPLPTELWLVAVDPRNDTFNTPELPFYGRLRGHLNDPNFANCANADRIFVVEEVVAVYEATAPKPGGWPRKPADFDTWLVYGNPMLGFRLSYPPHWQAEVLEEEGLLGGLRFTSTAYPDNPIILRVHNGEASPEQYAPEAADGSLGAGSFMQDDNRTDWPDSQQLDGFVVDWETEPGMERKSVMIVTNGRSYEFTLTYPTGFAASQPLLTDFTMMVQSFRTITAVSPILSPVLTWQREENGRCEQAKIGTEWVEAGTCEGEMTLFPLPAQQQQELAIFRTFTPFSTKTNSGQILFNSGAGDVTTVPFPAQERMLAYWGWATFATVTTGAPPDWNQAVTWQSTATPCQQLVLTLSGMAHLLTCDNEVTEVGWMMIPPDDLAQLYRWVDELAVTKTAVFTLNGHGNSPINPEQESQINYLAQNLAATIAINATNSNPSATRPIAEAGYFTVAGWSNDSQWLAYWSSTPADVDTQQPYAMPGGTLQFANVVSGELCEAKELHTATSADGAVYWQTDNQLIVTLPNGSFSGRPCEPFTPLPDFVPPQPHIGNDSSLSVNGRYRAATTTTYNDDNTLTATTVITDTQTETAVHTLTWQHPGGLGDLGLGGMWVSPTQFLIFTDFTQGPLLIDLDKGSIPILTGLPGLTLTPPAAEAEYQYEAQAIPGNEPNTFTLIISTRGIEAGIPITLYHAASGIAETLPFEHIWSTSQNQEWLFLYESTHQGNHIWGRRVADVGGEWELIAPTASSLLWNQGETELAFSQAETHILWQTFPELTPLGAWITEPYWTYPAAFSPNGRYLVAQGNLPGTWQYGLFVFEQ